MSFRFKKVLSAADHEEMQDFITKLFKEQHVYIFRFYANELYFRTSIPEYKTLQTYLESYYGSENKESNYVKNVLNMYETGKYITNKINSENSISSDQRVRIQTLAKTVVNPNIELKLVEDYGNFRIFKVFYIYDGRLLDSLFYISYDVVSESDIHIVVNFNNYADELKLLYKYNAETKKIIKTPAPFLHSMYEIELNLPISNKLESEFFDRSGFNRRKHALTMHMKPKARRGRGRATRKK